MAEIYYTPTLINNDYLAAYSPLPVNYNYDEIRPFITIAESIWVVDVLGKKLYDELLVQVQDNTVTPENSTLLLKIYPYLAMAVTFEALPFIAHHFSEKGITNGKSDNSEPVTNAQLVNIQNHIRTELEVLKRMLKDFMKEHSDCYPSFQDTSSTCAYTDDCCFADLIWNGYDADTIRTMRWKALRAELKNKPNSNLRMYSNN